MNSASPGQARFRRRRLCRRSPLPMSPRPDWVPTASFTTATTFFFRRHKPSSRAATRSATAWSSCGRRSRKLAGANAWEISHSRCTAVGYSAFANFLDDFSGPSAIDHGVFGATVFHPDQFRQTYFLPGQLEGDARAHADSGAALRELRPAGELAAVSGLSPDSTRRSSWCGTKCIPTTKDFGPAFGLAWSPSPHSGWLGRFFGDGKTVWRGGYQISYDAFFTQLSGQAVTTPNAITTTITAPNTGRGSPNWFEQLPTTAAAPALTTRRRHRSKSAQSLTRSAGLSDSSGNCRKTSLLDVSYVGSESHRLTTRADWNPRLLTGVRLYPNFGPATVRTSQGNSSYHALQARLDRRFSRGFQLSASYTWSKLHR